MTEEATEASVVKEMSNGDSPVVSDDVLQNMRRGLFGKSVPQDEPTPLSGADLQETSNGSADTDDSKKNGVSFEDKELPDQREDIDVEDVVVEKPEVPVVEEPEGSIEAAQEPEANPEAVEDMEIIEIQEAEINVPVVEADPANVEIPERAEADEEVEPYVVDVENNGEEVIHIEEIPEENVEVEEPIQERIQVEEEAAQVMEVDEEPEEDEHPEDPVVNNAATNGVVEASASPPSTPVQPAAEEEEAENEIEVDVEDEPNEEEKEEEMVVVEEEEETPQSSRRSKRAVKEEEAPKSTPKGRGRRGAQKEEVEETKTPKRGGRRGAKQEEEKAEEPVEEEEEVQEKTPVEDAPVESKRSARRGRGQAKEEPKEEKAETPKRGTRRGRGKKEEEEHKEEEQDEETEEKMEEEHIDVEGEEEPKSTKRGPRGKGKTPASAPKRGGRRGKVEEAEPVEEGEDDEEPEEKEEIEKPKRSTRRGRAESGSEKSVEVKETPRRGAKRGQPKEEEKKKEDEAEEDQIGLEEEGEEPEEAPKSKRRSTRGKAAQTPAKAARGKKAEVKKEEEEKDEEGEEDEEKEETEEPTPKRALRTRGAKAEPPASSKSAKGRSRSQKKEESDIEEEAEDVKEEPKTSKGRGKKAAKAKTSIADPYDVDSQFDQHPDPLKNVVVCEGMFGSTKYGKIGSGKYTFTERAAEERIGNLSDLLPKQVNRRSLADLTPGRRRGPGTKGTKSAPPARKRKGNDSDEEMDIDEPGSSKAGSRKRKSSPATVTPSKSAKLELPSLNDDKQWIVDHPPDEHAPIEIGARVYAVFDKIYYPAVIIAERDGLGRYKVSFDEDKVIRDIPAQGIVPLRAVVADKECYYSDDGAIIVACPNAASASEWAKAIFTIRLLDNEGEVTGNDIRCAWSKLSLDMNDWKDYIHQKSIEATAVAADNISAHSRTRRSHAEAQKAATPQHKPTKPTPKATKSVKKAGKTRAEGESTEAKEGAKEEEEEEEEEEELDCFAGMVFLLTSAQRDGNSNFKKKMLVDFIVERKGLVVEDFNDLETFGDRRPFLISDTYYRTHKYLSALAKGVPCVSHEWIHKCVELETAVDYTEFVLPAGTSSIDGRLFPLPVNQNVLLSGKNVLIYSGNNLHNPRALNYYNIWAPLVTYMGGHPIRNLNDLGRNERINIIISDNSITDAMLDRADHDGSWVVTSEWLIHAIIMDETTDPETFPRFKVARANRNFPPSDPE